ncbi:1535_t:CDS:2, partial [Racocetra persica]
MPQLRQDTLEFIGALLDRSNPFIANFRLIFSLDNIDNLCLYIKADHGLDQRIYNMPTASQVAAVWIEGNNPTNYARRDIIVHSRTQGDYGWHPAILQNASQKK